MRVDNGRDEAKQSEQKPYYFTNKLLYHLFNMQAAPALQKKYASHSNLHSRQVAHYLQQINFPHSNDYTQSLSPNNLFWKLLVDSRRSLMLHVPDTIVINEQQMSPFWVYSEGGGLLESTQRFNQKDIVSKFSFGATPDELVAIVKKADYNSIYLKNQTNLVSCRNLSLSLNKHMLQSSSNEVAVVQRFVKSKGPRAFICRTIMRKFGKNQSWIITNKKSYYSDPDCHRDAHLIVNTGKLLDCNIINTNHGQFFKNTMSAIQRIVSFMADKGVVMSEFAADFIKDQGDICWLVGVKSFKFTLKGRVQRPVGETAQKSEKSVIKQSKSRRQQGLYQKTRLCNYCEMTYLQVQLKFKMTTKMIIETDKFLLHRGKRYDWLARSDVSNLQTESLYQELIVCQRCYTLYKHSQQLLELQYQLAVKTGVTTNEDSKYQITCVGNREFAQASKQSALTSLRGPGLPQRIQVSHGCQIRLNGNTPIKCQNTVSKMLKYRMMIFFSTIKQVHVSASKVFYIQYAFLGQKIKYKVDSQPVQKTITLNKLKIFYLFSPNQRAVNEFFQQSKPLHLTIYTQDSKRTKEREIFATLDIELSQLYSQKFQFREFYKMFNLRNGSWGWGLSATIGLSSDGELDCSRLVLKNQRGIYIPPLDYFTCAPLPQQWQILLYQLEDIKKNQGGEASKDQLDAQSKTLNSSTEKGSLKRRQKQKREQSQLRMIKQGGAAREESLLMRELRSYKRSISQHRSCRRKVHYL